jgi:hypothetical protein
MTSRKTQSNGVSLSTSTWCARPLTWSVYCMGSLANSEGARFRERDGTYVMLER